MRNHIRLSLLAAVALSLPAAPAAALLSVRYDGMAQIRSDGTSWQYAPGALNGSFRFSAIFYYSDLGEQRAATLIVGDVLRAHYTICQAGWPEPGACQPLSITPTTIGSNTGTTPEDYISMGVNAPGGFGGAPLSGLRRRSYDVVAADITNAELAWTLFYDASGYAWNQGSGTIGRVTTAVPEPASWLLLLGGYVIIGGLLRRRPRITRVSA